MADRLKFYIDGAWVAPASAKTMPVVNPATEEAMYEIALGGAADVDKAVAAARRAFESYSMTTPEERAALLQRVIEVYKGRMKEIAAAISDEMGAPLPLAERAQAAAGLGHLMTTLEVLKTYPFEERLGSAMLLREPVGVAGMITPWNWPLNQIACKVAPALAAGCTMVLKPSEYTPTSALIFAEVLHEAGRTRGRIQPRQRAWAGGGRGHGLASGPRHDLVHRLDAGGHRRGPARGSHREARHPGAWRQIGQHHPRRR